MIFSNIRVCGKMNGYPSAIKKAIDYLKETDFSAMEDGVYEIDGRDMFAQVFHYTSKAKDDCPPETHKKYLDVQFWICGEELFGVAPSDCAGSMTEEIPARDICFYDGVRDESFVHATAGCFAVFFPHDVHRPGVFIDRQALTYRKVVVKVSVDLL